METIALIERLDSEGQVLQMHRVHRWPQRLGRAVDNDLVIDDPHVAAHHATLAPLREHPGVDTPIAVAPQPIRSIELTVGQSINGVSLPAPRKRQAAQHARSGQNLLLASGTVFQMGGVLLRLRLPSELLQPELPLPPTKMQRPWVLPLMALLGLAGLAFDQWTQSNASTSWLDILTPVLAGPLAVGLWCASWALLSKLFQGRFAFGMHLRIALPWVVGLSLLVPLMHQASFSVGWPSLSRITPLLEAAGSCALLWCHFTAVLPRRRLRSGVVIAMGFVAVSLFMGYNQHKAQKRWFSELYASTISLPALRLVPAKPIEGFMQSLRPLEVELIGQVNDKDDEEAVASDAGE